MLRHAFGPLGCRGVEWERDARNARSRRAILRLGATEEGTLRKHMVLPDGSARDTVYFSVTDDSSRPCGAAAGPTYERPAPFGASRLCSVAGLS